MVDRVDYTLCEEANYGQARNDKRKFESLMQEDEQSQIQPNRTELDTGEVATVPSYVEKELTLIDLNDDCLCKILEYLPFYYLNKVRLLMNGVFL